MMRPPLHRAAAALVAIAVGACADDPVAPPLPVAGAPAALVVRHSGYGVGTTSVELLPDGRLRWRHASWDDPRRADSATVAPDAPAWAAFWRALDAAGVRSWPGECANRDVVDGGGYTLDVAWTGGRVRVATSNAWPGRGGRCDRRDVTPEFDAFLAAVHALVGRPFPGSTPLVAALPTEGPPAAFRVAVWSLPLGGREIVLRGDTLVATWRPAPLPGHPSEPHRVVPDAGAWRTFWSAVERSGVRYWPAECRDDRVADGTSVEIDLVVPAGRLRSTATNAWPRPGGACVVVAASPGRGPLLGGAEPLDAFLAAVAALLGAPFP